MNPFRQERNWKDVPKPRDLTIFEGAILLGTNWFGCIDQPGDERPSICLSALQTRLLQFYFHRETTTLLTQRMLDMKLIRIHRMCWHHHKMQDGHYNFVMTRLGQYALGFDPSFTWEDIRIDAADWAAKLFPVDSAGIGYYE
jgi:hypothetical protein